MAKTTRLKAKTMASSWQAVSSFAELDAATAELQIDTFAERSEDGRVKEAVLAMANGVKVPVPELISNATQAEIEGRFLDEVSDTVFLSIRATDLVGHPTPLSENVTATLPTYPGWAFAVSPQRSTWGGAMHRVAFVRTIATGLANHERGNQ